jgi:eukaryotic-like serine/threonine-protein kinase
VTVLADRYELGDPIARGGMSTVVRGVDTRLRRPVAIKLLREDLVADASARARFEREARSVARLHSPSIVQVYDVGIDGNQPYLVMELVEGETLADRIGRAGPLPPAAAVAFADQLLGALEVSHDAGVVHRDVKPSNVLLPADGGLKLADFGIAKAVGSQTSSLTVAGQVLGTPTYLSPEQVSGNTAGPPADVYATGVILYQMLAGRPPFTGEEPLGVALAHQREVPQPIEEAAPGVPPDLAAVVTRALEKDPAHRFADAGAMRAALRGGADVGTTAVLPAAAVPLAPSPGQTSALPPHEPVAAADPAAPRRGWLLAAALVAAVLVIGAVAFASGGDDPTVTDETLPPTDSVPDETEPDQTEPEETQPPETEAPATDPPATEPPATAPPETDPPVVDPATAGSIGELASIIEADPEAYGKQGGELAKRLAEIDDADADERHKPAQKLLDKLEEWEDKGDIDPAAAARAREFVAPLAEDPDDDDDDDD